jgi:hypothetical protein
MIDPTKPPEERQRLLELAQSSDIPMTALAGAWTLSKPAR